MSDCPICDGKTCLGGGNLRCARRDPLPSRIAAVLDRYGGVRVVVTHEKLLPHHQHCDEIMVVSDVIVHEPIGWNDMPGAIAHAEWVLDEWLKDHTPNEPWAVEACRMRVLRKLEHVDSRRSLNSYVIAET